MTKQTNTALLYKLNPQVPALSQTIRLFLCKAYHLSSWRLVPYLKSEDKSAVPASQNCEDLKR